MTEYRLVEMPDSSVQARPASGEPLVYADRRAARQAHPYREVVTEAQAAEQQRFYRHLRDGDDSTVYEPFLDLALLLRAGRLREAAGWVEHWEADVLGLEHLRHQWRRGPLLLVRAQHAYSGLGGRAFFRGDRALGLVQEVRTAGRPGVERQLLVWSMRRGAALAVGRAAMRVVQREDGFVGPSLACGGVHSTA